MRQDPNAQKPSIPRLATSPNLQHAFPMISTNGGPETVGFSLVFGKAIHQRTMARQSCRTSHIYTRNHYMIAEYSKNILI